MSLRRNLFATLLVATLASAALAGSAHHPPGGASSGACPRHGMGGERMPGHADMMSDMHRYMMRQMHGMMTQLHGAPTDQMGGMMHSNASTMPALEVLSGEEFEVAFMSTMIAHHQGAIEMADWVLERGDDPDVLAAARALQAAQDPEIEQMTAWLREWYNADVDAAWAGMMNADMGGMMDAMMQAPDPNSAFLGAMIHHHQGAIDMAQVALERAEHQELRDLARDIILAQVDEVHRYQTWLTEDLSE